MILSLDLGLKKTGLVVVDKVDDKFYVLHAKECLLLTRDKREKLEILKNCINEVFSRFSITKVIVERLHKKYKKKKNSMTNTEINALMFLYDSIVSFILRNFSTEIYFATATNGEGGFYGDNYLRNGFIGWRQKFTGLNRPSERDVLLNLKSLQDEGRLIFDEKVLNYIQGLSTKTREDIYDAIGMAISFYLYPIAFHKLDKKNFSFVEDTYKDDIYNDKELMQELLEVFTRKASY